MRKRVYSILRHDAATGNTIVGEIRDASGPDAAVIVYCQRAGISSPEEKRKLRARVRAKPTPDMLYVLGLARQQGADLFYVPLVDGKGSQSRTVGRSLTVEACQRHGWLDARLNLTAAGRAVLAKREALDAARDAKLDT